jgi:hypothetical protein
MSATQDSRPASSTDDSTHEPTGPQKKHLLQVVLDNPWILLVLGILIPAISYTAWGWIELAFIEAAQLP